MLLTIIFLLVCVVLGYMIVCRVFLPRVNELVPTCPGKWPIVGHSLMLARDETFVENIVSFGEYALKVGGVAKVFIGPLPVYGFEGMDGALADLLTAALRVAGFQGTEKILMGSTSGCSESGCLFVTDPVDVTTVLNKCLKKMFVYKFIEPMVGNMVIAAEVPVWKRNRRILDLCFKQHILDSYLEVFNDQAGRFVEELALNVGKGEVDLTEQVTKAVVETSCRTALGLRIDGQDLVDDNYINAIEELLSIAVARVMKPWLMSDFIFNWSSYRTKLNKAMAVASKLTVEMVEQRKSEHLQRLKNKGDFDYEGRKFQSFIDILLENTVTETSSVFTQPELLNIVDNVLVGGFDTTICELLYIIICIASYPEVQEKIYEEITQVLGEDGRVTKSNISQLVYLEAAIKESIRLYPVGGVVARETTRDTKLQNMTIPAGSSILVHIWCINRNTDYWGSDPEEFKPERWLNSDTVPSHRAAFATFSPGPRGCIGKTYAIMYLKTTMAAIIRRFKLSADHTKMKLTCNIMLKPVSGHLVKIEERK